MPSYLNCSSVYPTAYYNKSPIYGYKTRTIKSIGKFCIVSLLSIREHLIHLSSVSIIASIAFDLKKKGPKFCDFKIQSLSFQHFRVHQTPLKFKKKRILLLHNNNSNKSSLYPISLSHSQFLKGQITN